MTEEGASGAIKVNSPKGWLGSGERRRAAGVGRAFVAEKLVASETCRFGEAELGFSVAAAWLLGVEFRFRSVSKDQVAFVELTAAHAEIFVYRGAKGEDSERDGLMVFGVVSLRDFIRCVLMCESVVFPFVVIVEYRGVGIKGGDEGRSSAVRITKH